MQFTIRLSEHDASPVEMTVTARPDQQVGVFLAGDALNDAREGLRATLLRGPGADPPPDSRLMLDLRVVAARGDQPAHLRVLRTGRDLSIDLEGSEGTQLVQVGTRLGRGGQLTWGRLRFTIELELALGGRAFLSGYTGARRGWAVAGVGSTAWLVPTLAGAFASPKARAIGWLQARARALGIAPALFAPLLLGGTALVALGVMAWRQHRAASDAEARATEAIARAEAAEQGRAVALAAEQSCMQARGALAHQLNDRTARAEAAIDGALGLGPSRALAARDGGAPMLAEPLLALDKLTEPALRAAVGAPLAAQGEADLTVAGPCLEMADALGPDLPPYALLWHPDETLICPQGYVAVEGQVDRAGPWGLSRRMALAFAPPDGTPVAEALGTDADPRLRERWSAITHAEGLRAVQSTLLASGRGRAPALPSQVQLWALALWDALNRLPQPADGALDAPPEVCVESLLAVLEGREGAGAIGDPILPDIARVATEGGLPVAPTAGCPWPTDALTRGARAALSAVARQASAVLARPPDQTPPFTR